MGGGMESLSTERDCSALVRWWEGWRGGRSAWDCWADRGSGVRRWGDSLDIPRLRTTAESEERKGAVFMRWAPHRKEGLMRIKRHVKEADGGLLTVKQQKLSRRMRRGSKCRKRADDYVGIPDWSHGKSPFFSYGEHMLSSLVWNVYIEIFLKKIFKGM